MQHSGFKVGTIPITAQLLLYTFFTISVISGVIVNTLLWTTSFPEILIISLVSVVGICMVVYGRK